jgi:diadenosine tetraphosphate (Ap4A) HIT family hydrolase
LGNAELADDQVLMRGRRLYVCAPRGQLTEGYLAIAPYRCIGSLSQLPGRSLDELVRLKDAVEKFYQATYRVAQATFYEQGRAGGGAVVDEAGGFPLHAHLCCLPVSLDLHTILARAYLQRSLFGLHGLPVAAHGEPYVYVESLDALGRYRRSVYVAQSEEARKNLARLRLKPAIAGLMGLPGRGDWRAYPGDSELQQVVAKFATFRATPSARAGGRNG